MIEDIRSWSRKMARIGVPKSQGIPVIEGEVQAGVCCVNPRQDIMAGRVGLLFLTQLEINMGVWEAIWRIRIQQNKINLLKKSKERRKKKKKRRVLI
jgi:hypothetical protein